MIFVMRFYAKSAKWIVIAIEIEHFVLIFWLVWVNFTCCEKCSDCKQIFQPGHNHHILSEKNNDCNKKQN